MMNSRRAREVDDEENYVNDVKDVKESVGDAAAMARQAKLTADTASNG